MLATACSGSEANSGKAPAALCIATGSSNTVSFHFGKALADILSRRVPATRWTVRARTASVGNLNFVASTACDVAIAPADATVAAVLGGGPTRPPLPLQALARLYDNTVQLVVRKDSKITELNDLRGKRVSVGAQDSCTAFVANRLLTVALLKSEVTQLFLDIDDSLARMRDGDLDAFFWSGEVPSARIEQFNEQVAQVRLIDLGKLQPAMNAQYKGLSYLPATIPAKTYALDSDVRSLGVPNYLVVSQAMGDKLAYQVTKQLFEHRDELTRATAEARNLNLQIAIATQPVALHHGAVQYYRDIKP